jgi:hypothetical protein
VLPFAGGDSGLDRYAMFQKGYEDEQIKPAEEGYMFSTKPCYFSRIYSFIIVRDRVGL